MPNETAGPEGKSTPLKPSAIVLLLFYIVLTVAGHSDIDLVRPDTQVSLAESKVDLPSGWIFTPFIGLKLPIVWFYALAPVLILALHFELLRSRTTVDQVWDTALRFAGNILSPLALVLLLWKFAPYGPSRPPDVGNIQVAVLISYGHAVALLGVAALLLYAGLHGLAQPEPTMPARVSLLRRIGLMFSAIRTAALIGAVALTISMLGEAAVRHDAIATGNVRRVLGLSSVTFAIGAAVILAIIAAPTFLLVRRLWHSAGSLPRFGRAAIEQEPSLMLMNLFLFVLLLGGVALPDLGRPLNLSGAKLTAVEPSDVIMAAMVATQRNAAAAAAGQTPSQTAQAGERVDYATIRSDAWTHFGRGLDYSRWRFRGASFDASTMMLVRLDDADLTDASFIRAEMSGASLVGARLDHTTMVEANLRGADLSCVNATQCSVRTQLAQARPPTAGGGNAAPTPVAPTISARNACGQQMTGPKLDKANLTGAILRDANLNNANLRNATVLPKDARNVKLIRSDLTEAIFKAPDKGPEKTTDKTADNAADNTAEAGETNKFEGADFTNACLCGADLRDADLSRATLVGASLRGAELTGTKLPRNLQKIDFEGANVKGAIFYPDGETDLQGANLLRAVQEDRPRDFKPKCPQATPAR